MSKLFPLRVEGAVVKRRGKVLVGPIDLCLDGAGTTVVIGPNGAGKSTLLALLHGTMRLYAGQIAWACPAEVARPAQGFVFQRPIMLRRSVRDNLAYPWRLRGASRHEAMRRADEFARRFDLQDQMEMPAQMLSGGEQQKLALARALVSEPQVLFLDEPCASLDGRSTRAIEDILHQAKADGTRLILATHDMGQARRLADEVIFLLHGRVHERQPAGRFFEAPETVEALSFLRGDIVE